MHWTLVGQPELQGCCKINPLIRAINAIVMMSFPILATVLLAATKATPPPPGRNYKWGGDFKNTLLPISFQSSVLNTRYKKTLLQPFVLGCIFITGKPIKLEVFLILSLLSVFWGGFFLFFGNQNGSSLLFALRFPAHKKKKKAVLLFLSLIHPFCLLCCGQDFKS